MKRKYFRRFEFFPASAQRKRHDSNSGGYFINRLFRRRRRRRRTTGTSKQPRRTWLQSKRVTANAIAKQFHLCTVAPSMIFFCLFLVFVFHSSIHLETNNRIELLLMFFYLFIDLTKIGVLPECVYVCVWTVEYAEVHRHRWCIDIWRQTHFNTKQSTKKNSNRKIEWQGGFAMIGWRNFRLVFAKPRQMDSAREPNMHASVHFTMLTMTIPRKAMETKKETKHTLFTWKRSRKSLIIL